MTSDKKDFIRGIKMSIPVIFGYLTVACAFSIMADKAGLSIMETTLMSAMVYAGASQMIAVQMLLAGASISTILLSVFVVNLRNIILSTCVMTKLRKEKRSIRALASFFVTDESFAIFTTSMDKLQTAPFFWGLGPILYFAWVFGSAAGSFLITYLPAIVSNSLNITIYAMFISLIVPGIRKNKKLLLTVAITAALSFLFGLFMDSGWTVIIVTLLGAAIGTAIGAIETKEE